MLKGKKKDKREKRKREIQRGEAKNEFMSWVKDLVINGIYL